MFNNLGLVVPHVLLFHYSSENLYSLKMNVAIVTLSGKCAINAEIIQN